MFYSSDSDAESILGGIFDDIAIEPAPMTSKSQEKVGGCLSVTILLVTDYYLDGSVT